MSIDTRTGSWAGTLAIGGRAQASDLRRRYQEYCTREAEAFVRLIPRAGIRPLYGAAREWAKDRELHDTRDPMSALLAYLLSVLPLPPFEVWLADREANRFDHVVAWEGRPAGAEASPAATADRRIVRHRRRSWDARLRLFREGTRWRGYIAFEPNRALGGPVSFRTANIFLDRDPSAIRDRFREYHDETLRGFLRSVLP